MIGAYSGVPVNSGALSNTTAVGANAAVSQSNTLVLGNTTAGSPGAEFVNVGIGTDTPRSIAEMAAVATNTLGPVLTLSNDRSQSFASGGGVSSPYESAAAVDFNTYLPSVSGTYNPSARIQAVDSGLQQNMVVSAYGQVGIGTPITSGVTDGQLVVVGNSSNDGAWMTGAQAASGAILMGGPELGGIGGDGVDAYSGGGTGAYAGYFGDDVHVEGTLSATLKEFKIDDPLDPAN